jgi:hypothetical protein
MSKDPDARAAFVIARNPEEYIKLPYLIRLPIDGGLALKAHDTWPRSARVYSHPFQKGWPPEAEVLEETPVAFCRRRGGCDQPRSRSSASCQIAVRLHGNARPPGHLLADAEDRKSCEPRRTGAQGSRDP